MSMRGDDAIGPGRSDKESFLDFFQSTPEIPQMFADAGVQVEPHPVFWEKVDTAGNF
jgi:hypothetical protein